MRLLTHDIDKLKKNDRLGTQELGTRLKKTEREREYFKEKALTYKQDLHK